MERCLRGNAEVRLIEMGTGEPPGTRAKLAQLGGLPEQARYRLRARSARSATVVGGLFNVE
jgi:hypothetical protein